MTLKFKIGDRVKVANKDEVDTFNLYTHYCKDMDDYFGKTGVITNIDDSNIHDDPLVYRVQFEDSEIWWFIEEDVSLVSENSKLSLYEAIDAYGDGKVVEYYNETEQDWKQVTGFNLYYANQIVNLKKTQFRLAQPKEEVKTAYVVIDGIGHARVTATFVGDKVTKVELKD